MYICLSSPSSQSRITIPGMSVDDHRVKGGPGHVQTNQLHVHDINWGALDHASCTPQLMSCNYYVCMYMYMYVRVCVCVRVFMVIISPW